MHKLLFVLFLLPTLVFGQTNTSDSLTYSKITAPAEQEQYQNALELTDSAIAVSPENPDFYYIQALIRYEMNELDGAIESCTNCLTVAPWAIGASVLKAEILIEKGAYLKVLTELEPLFKPETIAADQVQEEIGICLIFAYSGSGYFQKAITLYEGNYIGRKSGADFYNEVGHCYANLNQYEKARSTYSLNQKNESANKEAGRYEHHLFIGMTFIKEEKHNDALAPLYKALEQGKGDPRIHFELGVAYYGLSKDKEALEQFDLCLSIAPTYGPALLNRGVTKENLGDRAGACKDWNEAAQLGESDAITFLKDCN